MPQYTEVVAAKLTPEQKQQVCRRAAELGLPPAEYCRKVLLESLDASRECRLILGEIMRSSYFIETLMIAWLRELPISEDLLGRFRSDSERRKARLVEAAIARAREAAGGGSLRI